MFITEGCHINPLQPLYLTFTNNFLYTSFVMEHNTFVQRLFHFLRCCSNG